MVGCAARVPNPYDPKLVTNTPDRTTRGPPGTRGTPGLSRESPNPRFPQSRRADSNLLQPGLSLSRAETEGHGRGHECVLQSTNGSRSALRLGRARFP